MPCSPGTPDFDDDDLLRTPKNGHLWSMDHRFICKPTDLSLGIARQIILRDVTNTKWVIKLNQGFSGKGNASLDIETVQSKISRDSNGKALMDDVNMMVYEIAVDIENKFPQMKFECGEISWCGDRNRASFIDQMSRLGAIAEAYIEGPCVASPSVQAVVDPALEGADRVKILSTHEQVRFNGIDFIYSYSHATHTNLNLKVLSGQIYSGCINPANSAYRTLLVEYTKKIGGKLAEYNIVTHFSVDFVATNTHVDGSGRWNIIGIEINLRQGGTTHPYSTMATLCGGQISPDGVFQTKEGKERCYEATDNFFDNRLIGVESSAFLSEYRQSSDPLVIKLRWNQEQKVGVVFHLFPLLQVGKLGFTAIAETPHQASALFKGTVEMLDSMANKLNTSR